MDIMILYKYFLVRYTTNDDYAFKVEIDSAPDTHHHPENHLADPLPHECYGVPREYLF